MVLAIFLLIGFIEDVIRVEVSVYFHELKIHIVLTH
jgi:hypothetical protein